MNITGGVKFASGLLDSLQVFCIHSSGVSREERVVLPVIEQHPPPSPPKGQRVQYLVLQMYISSDCAINYCMDKKKVL